MAQTYRNQIDRNMGSLDVTTNCSVCCGHNKELKTAHIHLSTAYYNRRMAAEKVDLPKCHFCDIEHGIDNMTRNRVVLSDTSLSGIQFLEEWSWGDVRPVHVDTECIEEASINTLRRAWERAYHSNPLPIDTVLVAGYHDISTLICQHSEKHTSESLTNLVTAEVIGAIRMLHNTIARHSDQYGVQDSLAVAPILHNPSPSLTSITISPQQKAPPRAAAPPVLMLRVFFTFHTLLYLQNSNQALSGDGAKLAKFSDI